jgi:general secretion pathway protein L
MAAVWLLLYSAITLSELNNYKSRNTELGIEIEDIYQKAFPGSKRIVNPRVQMEQKLNDLRNGLGAQGSQFLALLTDAVPIVAAQKDISIQSIDFRNNRMEMGLTGTNLQAIENLNKQLNANINLKAEITTATSEKNNVSGSIRLQRSES